MQAPATALPPTLDPQAADEMARGLFDQLLAHSDPDRLQWLTGPATFRWDGTNLHFYLYFDLRLGGWIYSVTPGYSPMLDPSDLKWRTLNKPTPTMSDWVQRWARAKVLREGTLFSGGLRACS